MPSIPRRAWRLRGRALWKRGPGRVTAPQWPGVHPKPSLSPKWVSGPASDLPLSPPWAWEQWLAAPLQTLGALAASTCAVRPQDDSRGPQSVWLF